MGNRSSKRQSVRKARSKPAADGLLESPHAVTPHSLKTEQLICRIFKGELCPLIGMYANAIDAFVDLVEREFSLSSTAPCWTTKFDNPWARAAWKRISTLRRAVGALFDMTLNTGGVLRPSFDNSLTVPRVARPSRGKGKPIVWLSQSQAELLGWLTPNERSLFGLLRNIGPVALEERAAVDSQRKGLAVVTNDKGEQVTYEEPSLAQSDASIADLYPMLVRPDLAGEAMAVSLATIQNLRRLTQSLRAWRPTLERARSPDPNWRSLIHTYARITHPEPRRPTPSAPPTIVPVALTTDHQAILDVLHKTPTKCQTVIDIASIGPIRNRETVGRLLTELARLRLVYRPYGRRKGYAIAEAGREYLAKPG